MQNYKIRFGQYSTSEIVLCTITFRKLVNFFISNSVLFFSILFISFRYESCIDVEIQQRAAEYLALSRRGAALVDILAEMPKFPERQVICFAVSFRRSL